MWVLSEKEVKKETLDYKKSIIKNKFYDIFFVICTVFLLCCCLMQLIYIYVFPEKTLGFEEEEDTDWVYLIMSFLIAGMLLIFVPVTIVWYVKTHERVQAHMPIIVHSKTIDIMTILVGVFNFFTAILAALAPIVYHKNEDYSFNEDEKVIIYIGICATIFLIWSILFPIAQEKLQEKDLEDFDKYEYYEYDKVSEYVEYLKSVYTQRAKEFNSKIKKINYRHVNSTPVDSNNFSYYNRRVFLGKKSKKYGDEYALIKYCVFIQIFEHIHPLGTQKEVIRQHVKRFMFFKDKHVVNNFNQKVLRKYSKK